MPNPAWQSAFLARIRQCPSGPPVNCPQTPVLPVVSTQKQLGFLRSHATVTSEMLLSEFAAQMLASRATHVDLSCLPFFGFCPWQMPELHLALLPVSPQRAGAIQRRARALRGGASNVSLSVSEGGCRRLSNWERSITCLRQRAVAAW